MNTLLLGNSKIEIEKAAQIIKDGGLVGMPTETVYGLAADALNGEAVAGIFKAKGRPMDNPLIVHISDVSEIEQYGLVSEFPEKARLLAESFWPGPLTVILPSSQVIPYQVSAGLDTVAIRCPSHPTARALIKAAQTPLAAPSANISGSPSPTTAQHVINDLSGKIDAVIDGGICSVGLESTVITLATEKPRLLRPGGITVEQLEEVIGEVEIDDAVLHKLAENCKAASPGMKYRHYSPKANVIIVKGSTRQYIDYVNKIADKSAAALCYTEDIDKLSVTAFDMGSQDDASQQAHRLFEALRQIDLSDEIKTVYARCPDIKGVGLAVYNRLIRAAGFEVKNLEDI